MGKHCFLGPVGARGPSLVEILGHVQIPLIVSVDFLQENLFARCASCVIPEMQKLNVKVGEKPGQ